MNTLNVGDLVEAFKLINHYKNKPHDKLNCAWGYFYSDMTIQLSIV